MKKLVYVWMAFLAVTISISGCKQTAPKMEEVVVDSDSIVVNEIAELDSTVYGVCGDGCSIIKSIAENHAVAYFHWDVEYHSRDGRTNECTAGLGIDLRGRRCCRIGCIKLFVHLL